MPLAATTIIDVRTTGSDTANGGMFDPGQTAGMFADGAATSATGDSPVFTSASYNFVAGDVGAWLYIASGTNWRAGWYQIASVAANAATLSAALGAYYVATNRNPVRLSTSTAPFSDTAGCATTASPTGATWSIDYSQQNAAQFTYTDLASTGAGLTVSSAALPFAKQQVGNSIVITGGTNFTAGRYVIASVAAGVATVVGPGNITSGVGASGTGGLGGALATPGQAGAVKVAGADVFIKSGTYTLTGNTVNTAGCQVSDTTGGTSQTNVSWWVGWDTTRAINCPDTTWPTINAGTQTSLTLFSLATEYARARNLVVDGNAKSTLTGFVQGNYYQRVDHIKAQNCTASGIILDGGNGSVGWFLSATACSGTAAIHLRANGGPAAAYYSEAWANTIHGFLISAVGRVVGCISSGNTGASTDGFGSSSIGYDAIDCVAYGNGRDGFDASNNVGNQFFANCIAEANSGSGWRTGAVRGLVELTTCAGYNNTSGNFTLANVDDVQDFKVLTASAFTNPGSGDFSLNSTAGGGAVCRAAGFPGVFPRGTTTGYADIGAAEPQNSGGSSPANPLSLILQPPSAY